MDNLEIRVAEIKHLVKESSAPDDVIIKSLNTDSRRLESSSWFIPLKGERFDAHDFLDTVITAKPAGIVHERGKVPAEIPSLLVEDTNVFFQEVAAFWRNKVNPYVIAVTGTNGKTSTKNLLAFLFAKLYGEENVRVTQGNLNNHFGVPMTLLSLRSNTQVAIVEIGMNHPGEIAELSKFVRPDLSVITSIGEGHIGFFSSLEEIAREKASILAHQSGEIFIIPESIRARDEIEKVAQSFGKSPLFPRQTERIESKSFSRFRVKDCEGELAVAGEHQWQNFLLAWEALYQVGGELLTPQKECEILAQLKEYRNEKGRLQPADGKWCTLWDDTYNANPASFRAAIASLENLNYDTILGAFGEMGELGEKSMELHTELAAYAAQKLVAVCFVSDNEIIREAFQQGWISGGSSSEALKLCTSLQKTDCVGWLKEKSKGKTAVLLKGSRAARMEEIKDPFLA